MNGALSFLNDRAILIAAGTTGLLFGLHPLHVESVAWVAERKDLLCALFFLLSIMAYTKYASSRERGGRGQESAVGSRQSGDDQDPGMGLKNRFLNKHYLWALGFFVLALQSKPMAVTLPVVLLILDWYPFDRMRSLKAIQPVFVEKIPFFALSLGSSILTVLAQQGTMATLDAVPFSVRLLVAIHSLMAYLVKMLWPWDLIPFYPYPKNASLLSLEYLSAIVLVIGLTAGCIIMVKKQKGWLAAWGYYIVTLVPVLGIVQVGSQAMADRYTYLPGLGPFLIMGLATAWTTEKVKTTKRGGPAIKATAAGAALGVVIALSSATVQQIGIWKNTITLWNCVIEKEPDGAPQAYNNRGLAFKNMGLMREAISDFDKAIALNPAYALAFNNRGVTFKKIGMFNEAIEDFTAAIALNPDYYKAYGNRAIAYGKIGRFDKAIEDFNKALALNPSYYETYLNLGVFYGEAGMLDKALESFNQALAGDPNYAEAYYNRGFTYSLMGQDRSALADFNKALALNQNLALAYFNRGKLFMRTGQKERGLADFQKACDLGNQGGCNALRQ
jgi:Tfp pilus assembly protein PilF